MPTMKVWGRMVLAVPETLTICRRECRGGFLGGLPRRFASPSRKFSNVMSHYTFTNHTLKSKPYKP